MAGDPYYNNVSLLLHCDGSNGSTTFTDTSPSPKTVTPSGNAQVSTAQSKYGGASVLLDGTGDYLTLAGSTDLDLIGADFTIEGWIYPTQFKATGTRIFSTCGSVISWAAANGIHLLMQLIPSGELGLSWWNGSTEQGISTSTPCQLNTWQHISATVSGGTAYVSVGGTVTSTSASPVRPTGVFTAAIGTIPGENGNSTYAFSGYMDEIRITKGVGRYIANFTPSTTAFGDSLGVYGISVASSVGTSVSAFDLPQTGQVITSANGTAVANAAVVQSGQAIVSAGGVTPAALDLAPSGLAITSQQGTFAEVLNGLFLALTGQSFTSASGTPVYDLSSALAGFQIAVNQGSVSAFIEMFVALTGLESSLVEGAISALVSKVLAGSTSAFSEGILIPGKGFSLTGKQLSLSKGTPRHSVQIGATGYELTFSGGQIIYSVPLGSQLLTASKGAIKAVNDKTLSGSAIQVDAGAAIAALSKMAVGQSITVERGDTVATFTKSLANNLIIMSGKGEIVFDSRDVTIAMAGKTITTSEGTIYIGADKWYNFTRVLAGGTDVTIVHLA